MEYVFVDTSVWVEALRSEHSKEAVGLGGLLDQDRVAMAAPVYVELLCGASSSDLARLKRTLSSLPRFFPGPETWELIDSWIGHTVSKGERFGFADLLIAAITVEAGGVIWSNDNDFIRMERLGFLKRHVHV